MKMDLMSDIENRRRRNIPKNLRLWDPLDAEDVLWESGRLENHTKITIARYLERQHGWNRAALWRQPLAALRAAVVNGVMPEAPAEAPEGDGGDGRGRGRGRVGLAGGRGGRGAAGARGARGGRGRARG